MSEGETSGFVQILPELQKEKQKRNKHPHNRVKDKMMS